MYIEIIENSKGYFLAITIDTPTGPNINHCVFYQQISEKQFNELIGQSTVINDLIYSIHKTNNNYIVHKLYGEYTKQNY